jgi:hypothetical protein
VNALRVGDNVLAVEVHNYNPRSADITLGIAMSRTEPIVRDATLGVEFANSQLTLRWDQPGFTLQTSASPDGSWTDVASESPFTTTASDAQRYYRLRK